MEGRVAAREGRGMEERVGAAEGEGIGIEWRAV